MSMRLLVALLAGALATGPVLAVSAPGAMDVPSAEPRDDLFASKPVNPAPVVAPPPVPVAPPAAVDRMPAAPSPQRVLSDNPLWAIPLSRLTNSRERPLFAPTRRPPAPVSVAMPAPVQAGPPPKPPEPETPQLSLLGTIIGSEKIGLFMDSASKSVVRLRAGDNHNGWTLRAVERRQVELARGLDRAVLDIPSPDMKGGRAPGGPMLAGPPPIPAAPPVAMPAAPPPSAANGGTYVHPGANMNLPIGRAMPANLKLPAGLANPLATQGQR
jgi:general secretion pathway protein N